jgi:hypothetical protein
VILDDFNHADAIFIFGQNPGTNSPRMLNDLHAAARRGGQIVTFNPLKERALERFADPKNVIEMATFSSTPISINRSHVVHGREALVLLCIARSATCRQRGRSSSRSRTQPAWSKLRRVKTSRQALFFSQSQRLSRGSLAQHCQTREIFGQRRDLFLSREEMKKRALLPYALVDLRTVATDNTERVARGFKVVPYDMPAGACAAYYPETNGLVPLYSRDEQSGTPTSKSIPVRIFPGKTSGPDVEAAGDK